MKNLLFEFTTGGVDHEIELVFVEGTTGEPYLFGADEEAKQSIDIEGFYISKHVTTQALWTYLMDGNNPSGNPGATNPVECVSYDEVVRDDGFFDRINATDVRELLKNVPRDSDGFRFRLPSETEWEYAARGGRRWRDDYRFSGSDDIDEVAWYLDNSGRKTHPVGQKKPNQLGLYDMSGNVWEWCEDLMVRNTGLVPKDGKPQLAAGTDRILRGGCNHNQDIHCTVSKRYEIGPAYSDACIGFRIVFGP